MSLTPFPEAHSDEGYVLHSVHNHTKLLVMLTVGK